MGQKRLTIQRVEGWESNLSKIVEEYRQKPFSWGGNNCCSFAFECLHAITGKRILKAELATVTNAKTSKAIIDSLGGIAGAIRSSIFTGEGSWNFAQRGDIVVFDEGQGDTCGIYTDNLIACPGKDGLEFKSLTDYKTTFFIGH